MKALVFYYCIFISIFCSCTKPALQIEDDVVTLNLLSFESIKVEKDHLRCELILPVLSKSEIESLKSLGPQGILVRVKKDQLLIGSLFVHFGHSNAVLFQNSSATKMPYTFYIKSIPLNGHPKALTPKEINMDSQSQGFIQFPQVKTKQAFSPKNLQLFTMKFVDFFVIGNFEGDYTLEWALFDPQKNSLFGNFISDTAYFRIQ